MYTMEVLSPIAQSKSEGKAVGAAARKPSLDGLTVGLLWNSKRGGETALEKVGALIKERYKDVKVIRYNGSMPCEKSLMERAKTECDAFVGSSADCGACTSWLIHDMVEMEKAGKPTVAIVSTGFEHDAMSTARAYGLPQFRYALVPDALTGLTAPQIERDVTNAIDSIIEVLTTSPDKAAAGEAESGASRSSASSSERVVFEAADSYAAYQKMNKQFLEQEWADGMPVIAPTPELVEAMLRGTRRRRDDLVAVMAPGNGLATVEKIAINAVMAGCEPVHLPILIAACEAYAGLKDRARALAVSTSPYAPLLVINGPIAKQVGVNSGQCALGPGLQSWHNIVIGRALRLMMINIGSSRAGRMDMDIIGTARKFGMCVAENVDWSPWDPYHVEKGHAEEESTVTIFSTRDEIELPDLHNWTPEGVLSSIAFVSAIPGGEYLSHNHPGEEPNYCHLVLLSPAHAQICGKAGWSKKAVRDFIFQKCRTSALRLMHRFRRAPEAIRPQWRWLLDLSDVELEKMTLPVYEFALQLVIMVVGGPETGKDLVFRCVARPATAVIRDIP